MLALPSLVHTAYFNTHMSVEKVDTSLGKFNWTLLDRQWSNTGYISVLENKQAHYRVLRADHSLLGMFRFPIAHIFSIQDDRSTVSRNHMEN